MGFAEHVIAKARNLDQVIKASGITDNTVNQYSLPPGYTGLDNPYWVAKAVVAGTVGDLTPNIVVLKSEAEEELLNNIDQLSVWIQQMHLISTEEA